MSPQEGIGRIDYGLGNRGLTDKQRKQLRKIQIQREREAEAYRRVHDKTVSPDDRRRSERVAREMAKEIDDYQKKLAQERKVQEEKMPPVGKTLQQRIMESLERAKKEGLIQDV